MTRQQFIDEVDSWSELIDFCNDEGCGYCEDIYDEYDRDANIDNDLVNMAREHNWQEMYQILESIPTGYDYYRFCEDYNDWIGLTDRDFNERKEEVLEWADDNRVWEEDEEDEMCDDEVGEDDEEDDDFVIDDESSSIDELMSVCSSQLQRIENDKKSAEAADDEAFKGLISDFNF